jgi:hypothetical protein
MVLRYFHLLVVWSHDVKTGRTRKTVLIVGRRVPDSRSTHQLHRILYDSGMLLLFDNVGDCGSLRLAAFLFRAKEGFIVCLCRTAKSIALQARKLVCLA